MKKTKKGFTLVELVIVVAVMAVLVAVAIPTVSAITESAKSSVNDTNAQTIESMIKLHLADVELKTNDGSSDIPDLQEALTDKGLGILSSKFKYTNATGICEYYTGNVPGTAEAGYVYISFDDDGVVSVTGEPDSKAAATPTATPTAAPVTP